MNEVSGEAPTSSSTGVTQLLKDQLLQRLVHVEGSFHLEDNNNNNNNTLFVVIIPTHTLLSPPCFLQAVQTSNVISFA